MELLKKYKLDKFFGLCIFNENYRHLSPEIVTTYVLNTDLNLKPSFYENKKILTIFDCPTVILDDEPENVVKGNYNIIPIAPFAKVYARNREAPLNSKKFAEPLIPLIKKYLSQPQPSV